jgi:D-amino-acid dehydrogenase
VRPAGGTYAPYDESGDAHLFTRNLAQACAARGVTFCYDTSVERLEADSERVRAVQVRRGGASVRMQADAVLVCLGVQSPFLLERLGVRLPVYPVKGYSVTIPVARPELAPSVCITDETHKMAVTRLGDRLRVAGTAELDGYDTSINEVRCAALLERARQLFPGAGDLDRAQKWAGLRPATPGNVPVIGRTRWPNLFLNTGHGTLGWTLCAGSGRSIADIMSGRTPPVDFRFRRGD